MARLERWATGEHPFSTSEHFEKFGAPVNHIPHGKRFTGAPKIRQLHRRSDTRTESAGPVRPFMGIWFNVVGDTAWSC